jgi:hypothetical protein
MLLEQLGPWRLRNAAGEMLRILADSIPSNSRISPRCRPGGAADRGTSEVRACSQLTPTSLHRGSVGHAHRADGRGGLRSLRRLQTCASKRAEFPVSHPRQAVTRPTSAARAYRGGCPMLARSSAIADAALLLGSTAAGLANHPPLSESSDCAGRRSDKDCIVVDSSSQSPTCGSQNRPEPCFG